MEKFCEEDSDGERVNALGFEWILISDDPNLCRGVSCKVPTIITHRDILSVASSVFDHLGLARFKFAPFFDRFGRRPWIAIMAFSVTVMYNYMCCCLLEVWEWWQSPILFRGEKNRSCSYQIHYNSKTGISCSPSCVTDKCINQRRTRSHHGSSFHVNRIIDWDTMA